MRAWTVIIALLVVAPLVLSQGTDSWKSIGTDALSDIDSPLAAASPFQELDILHLEANEEEGHFGLRLTVNGFDDRQNAARGTDDYIVYFAVSDQDYRLVTERGIPVLGGEPTYRTRLESLDDSTELYRDRSNGVMFIPDEAGVLTWWIPWSSMLDRVGIPVIPGDTLHAVYAEAISGYDKGAQAIGNAAGADPVVARDRVPDQGALEYVIQSVGRAAEGIVAMSPNPVRASNGAPTTFLFPLVISNFAPEDSVLELQATGMPEAWQAQPLANPIAVASGQTTTTSIAVTTTARHVHGGNDSFGVQVLSADAIQSEVLFTVHYTETAQPSGHHPTLAFFTVERSRSNPASDAADDLAEAVQGFYRNEVYMSTDEEAAEDDRVPVTASDVEGEGQGWIVPLSPTLGLGLDFTDEIGAATLPLQPSRDGTLQGVFIKAIVGLDRQGEWVALAEGTLDVGDLSGPETMDIPIQRSEGIDVVPYEPGQNMMLKVLVDYHDSSGTGLAPNLMPGGSLTLPLEEYQDVVPKDALSSLSLLVEPKHQSVNPGERVNYAVSVTGPTGAKVILDPLGLADGWTARISHPTLTIGSEGGAVTVQVQAPIDARHGEGMSFFIRATPQDGTAATAAGIRATVTEHEDLPDATALEPGGKDAPSWSAMLILAFVLALARRRHCD